MARTKKSTEKDMAYYKTLANLLVEQDSERDDAYEAYENMYHLEYDLPAEVARLPWVRKLIDHGPHDAVSAGKRTLSSVMPNIRFQPLTNMQEDKDRANEYEMALKWQLFGVNRRQGASIVADAVESALLYSAVAAQVIDLDWHIKYMKEIGRDTTVLERARRKGRFVVNLHNPRFVHVRKTSMGNEAVLLRVERSAIDVIEEWGDPDGTLQPIANENGNVVYYDLMDWTNRAVWCEGGEVNIAKGGASDVKKPVHAESVNVTLMQPSPHGLDFSPWVAVLGESSIEYETKHKYHPMLYAIHQSGAWETLNIAQTLAFSDHIAKAAQPSIAEEGPNPMTAEVDYTDPSKPMKVGAGNTVKQLNAQPVDPGKAEVIDRIRQDMERSTVSSILQGGGNLGANLAFASLNLATQTAVGALKPTKELAENAIAEICVIMMMWAKHTNKPILGYNSNTRDKENFGQQIEIDPKLYTEETLYITVELTPDVPTDRQQRANAASMMIQWGYPIENALEDVGVENPGDAIETWYQEKLLENRMQLAMQREQVALELEVNMAKAQQEIEIEMMRQEALMQMQAQMQGAQGGGEDLTGGGQANEVAGQPNSMNAQMMAEMMSGENPGGQPFNPAMGGMPSSMANPQGATAEGQVGGQTAGGQEPMPAGVV